MREILKNNKNKISILVGLITGLAFLALAAPSQAAYITSFNSPWNQNGTSLYYNSGNIGVGTSTPGNLFTISGTSGATLQIDAQGTPNNQPRLLLSSRQNGYYASEINFDYYGSYASSTGSVGHGLNFISGRDGYFDNYWFRNSSGNVGVAFANAAYPPSNMGGFATNMNLLVGGNAGIGTTAPGANLDVNTSLRAASANISGFRNSAGAVMSDASGNLYTQAGSSGVPTASTLGQTLYSNGTSWVAATSPLYNNGTNIGIGTTAPAAKLDISGSSDTFNVHTSGDSTFLHAGQLLAPSLSTGHNYVLLVGGSASNSNMAYFGFNNAGGSGSTNNFATIGLWNHDNILNVLANGNVGIGTTNPGTTLDINGAISSVAGLTNNLVLDPQFSDISKYWSVNVPASQTNEILNNGDIVNGIDVNTTTQGEVESTYVKVNPYKTYRFSIWMKENNTDSTLYFGLHTYNSSKTNVSSYDSSGTASTNHYFWAGDLPTTGRWYRRVGYLLPCNTANSWPQPPDAAGSYRMDCSTSYVRIRFYNLDAPSYGTGAGTDANFALPSIEEVQESSPAFSYNGSDYILYPYGNVGIGTKSTLAKLDVNGSFQTVSEKISGFQNSAGVVMSDTSGNLYTSVPTSGGGGTTLPNGTLGATLYNNGSAWVAATSPLYNNGTNVGIGTTNLSRKFNITSTSGQLRIGYDSSNYTDLITANVGYFYLNPSGSRLYVDGPGTNQILTYQSGGSHSTLSPTNLALQDGSANQKVLINASGYSYFNGGNLGIGTATPNALLKVQQSNGDYVSATGDSVVIYAPSYSYPQLQLTNNNLVSWKIQMNPDNSVDFRDVTSNRAILSLQQGANSNRILVKSNNDVILNSDNVGNVGIGASPGAKLDVNGSLRAVSENISGFSGSAGTVMTDASGNLYSSPSASSVLWGGSTSGSIWDLNSGNVGIGTTNPIAKLQSSGAAQVSSPTLGSMNGVSLFLTNTDEQYGLASGVTPSGSAWMQTMRTSGSTAYDLNLEPLGGNVGIGTTAPVSKLDISGGIASENGYNFNTAGSDNMLVNGDFEMGSMYGWTSGGSPAVVSGGYSGNYALQITGNGGMTLSDDYIPVDPSHDVYQLDAWVKKTVAGTTPGKIYFGYVAYNANKTAITTAPCGTYCYFAASGYTIPADGNWHKLSATNYGEGTVHPDFPVGTKYVRVLGLINYGASSDAVTLLDHVTLKRITKGPLIAGNLFSSPNIIDNNQYSTLYTTPANNLVVSSPGNVGIGTTAPGATLDVNGSLRTTSENISGFSGSAGTVMSDASGNLYTSVPTSGGGGTTLPGGTSGQTLRNNGTGWIADSNLYNNGTNVGIGTTVPGGKLDIGGGVLNLDNNYGLSMSDTSGNPRYVIKHGAAGVLGGTNDIMLTNRAAGGNVIIGTNNGSAGGEMNAIFIQNTSGNIGIGTTVPDNLLTLENSGTPTLDFRTSGTQDLVISGSSGQTIVNSLRTNPIYLEINSTPYLTISGSPNLGNIGVGTTAPGAKLDVNGSLRATSANISGFTNSAGVVMTDNSGNLYSNTSDFLTSSPDLELSQYNSYYYMQFAQIVIPSGSTSLSNTWIILIQGKEVPNDFAKYGLLKLSIRRDSSNNASYAFEIDNLGSDRIDPIYCVSNDGVTYNLYYKVAVESAYTGFYKFKLLQGSQILTAGTNITTNTAPSGTKYTWIASETGYAGSSVNGGTNYVPKFTASDVINNSQIYDNGTNVGIGTTNATSRLTVNGAAEVSRLGVYGTYSSYQVQGIWSIGNGYHIDTTNNNFGSQYGIVYAHTNASSVGTSKGPITGWGHQILFTNAGNYVADISLSSGNAYFAGNVGIGTTNPVAKLDVYGGNIKIDNGTIQAPSINSSGQPLLVMADANGNFYTSNSNPSFATSSLPYLPLKGGTMAGDIDMGGFSISNIYDLNLTHKITVPTIDPLYSINGTNYSTYASAISGGVKEEYVGHVKANQAVSVNGAKQYQAVIDFSKEPTGTDLWVWRQVVDFNKNNVEVYLTPYGQFAQAYYLIQGDKLIFRANKPVEISYRLVGKRFDWHKWPTKSLDQKVKGYQVPLQDLSQ